MPMQPTFGIGSGPHGAWLHARGPDREAVNRRISSWNKALSLLDDPHREVPSVPSPRRRTSMARFFYRPKAFGGSPIADDVFEELPISFGALPAADEVLGKFQVSFGELQVAADVVDSWFAGLSQEANDTGEPMPLESDIEEAKRSVLSLLKQLPEDTDVYLMDGGKIAIEVYGDLGYAFLLVCEPGGNALCIVTVNGVSRRARYESSRILPDCFVREGLNDVRRVVQGAHGFPVHYW